MQQLKVCVFKRVGVVGGFQNRATVIKTLFYMTKSMKVKFTLMILPDDQVLINHVTDILNIQRNVQLLNS